MIGAGSGLGVSGLIPAQGGWVALGTEGGHASFAPRDEVEIDEMCRRLLALRQPAASDLRFITTALKIVTDLERMGDLAVNVAERAIDLAQSPPLRPFHDLTQLAELSEIGRAHV